MTAERLTPVFGSDGIWRPPPLPMGSLLQLSDPTSLSYGSYSGGLYRPSPPQFKEATNDSLVVALPQLLFGVLFRNEIAELSCTSADLNKAKQIYVGVFGPGSFSVFEEKVTAGDSVDLSAIGEMYNPLELSLAEQAWYAHQEINVESSSMKAMIVGAIFNLQFPVKKNCALAIDVNGSAFRDGILIKGTMLAGQRLSSPNVSIAANASGETGIICFGSEGSLMDVIKAQLAADQRAREDDDDDFVPAKEAEKRGDNEISTNFTTKKEKTRGLLCLGPLIKEAFSNDYAKAKGASKAAKVAKISSAADAALVARCDALEAQNKNLSEAVLTLSCHVLVAKIECQDVFPDLSGVRAKTMVMPPVFATEQPEPQAKKAKGSDKAAEEQPDDPSKDPTKKAYLSHWLAKLSFKEGGSMDAEGETEEELECKLKKAVQNTYVYSFLNDMANGHHRTTMNTPPYSTQAARRDLTNAIVPQRAAEDVRQAISLVPPARNAAETSARNAIMQASEKSGFGNMAELRKAKKHMLAFILSNPKATSAYPCACDFLRLPLRASGAPVSLGGSSLSLVVQRERQLTPPSPFSLFSLALYLSPLSLLSL